MRLWLHEREQISGKPRMQLASFSLQQFVFFQFLQTVKIAVPIVNFGYCQANREYITSDDFAQFPCFEAQRRRLVVLLV